MHAIRCVSCSDGSQEEHSSALDGRPTETAPTLKSIKHQTCSGKSNGCRLSTCLAPCRLRSSSAVAAVQSSCTDPTDPQTDGC
jgi:hypothetical protein